MRLLISLLLMLLAACSDPPKPYPKYKYGDCVKTEAKNPFWRPRYDHLIYKLHDYRFSEEGRLLYQANISLEQARKYSFHADLSFNVPEDEVVGAIDCGSWGKGE